MTKKAAETVKAQSLPPSALLSQSLIYPFLSAKASIKRLQAKAASCLLRQMLAHPVGQIYEILHGKLLRTHGEDRVCQHRRILA